MPNEHPNHDHHRKRNPKGNRVTPTPRFPFLPRNYSPTGASIPTLLRNVSACIVAIISIIAAETLTAPVQFRLLRRYNSISAFSVEMQHYRFALLALILFDMP
jgi:hypothetical protein